MIGGYGTEAVRAAEEPALAAGRPLMREAAFALAVRTIALLRRQRRPVRGAAVLVLVGGGNNGGDGLYAAADLARRGLAVTAALLHAAPHAQGLQAARAAGVRLLDLGESLAQDELDDHPQMTDPAVQRLREAADRAQVWVDALAGIGVRGALRGAAAAAVTVLQDVRGTAAARALVVAVDTPSGVGADPAPVTGPVLSADLTVTFGAAKAGLLLGPGAAHAGRVEVAELPGLAGAFSERAALVRRLTTEDVAARWPRPGRADHKYRRGVVGVAAGSVRFPGAGVLCTGGALGIGAGMVRYLGPEPVAAAVLAAYPEVVPDEGRVQALVLGPGLAEDEDVAAAMAHAWPVLGRSTRGTRRRRSGPRQERVALVVDAGALAQIPADAAALRSVPVVLTPHAGELAALLSGRGEQVERDEVEADPWRWANLAAQITGATVLLKGAVTVVVGPDGAGYAQDEGTSWMATAGSGDVLAGILGAMLAQADDEADVTQVAAAAALVHGQAGRIAAAGGPLRAGAIAEAVPAAVRAILTDT